MDRVILFRGKRLNGKGWAEGGLSHLVQNGGRVFVFPKDGFDSADRYEVDPSTVGQYTGLTDKNGVKIFEGDVARKFVPVYELGQHTPIGEQWLTGAVIWDDTHPGELGSWALYATDEQGNPAKYIFDNRFEVIGNVHDNPELIGGEDDG